MKKIILALVSAAILMPMNAKTLVAYFSATGTTKLAAAKLAGQHKATLWEIEPKNGTRPPTSTGATRSHVRPWR